MRSFHFISLYNSFQPCSFQAIGSTISPMDVVEMVESTIIPPNTDRLISTPDNEVQLMRSFDTAKLMGSLLSRNLHNWWARYTEMMHLYRLSFDAKICTDRLNLNNSLNEIEDQVEKVKQTDNPHHPHTVPILIVMPFRFDLVGSKRKSNWICSTRFCTGQSTRMLLAWPKYSMCTWRSSMTFWMRRTSN